MGLSKIMIGPADKLVLPQELLIVKVTVLPAGQLKRVKVCGIGKS